MGQTRCNNQLDVIILKSKFTLIKNIVSIRQKLHRFNISKENPEDYYIIYSFKCLSSERPEGSKTIKIFKCYGNSI